MAELVRVKDLDTGHHINVPRNLAESNDRLQILADHSPYDHAGRLAEPKHRVVTKKKTPRPEPELMPSDTAEPNADENPAPLAEPSHEA
jgi:hypothetical protein